MYPMLEKNNSKPLREREEKKNLGERGSSDPRVDEIS